MAGANRGNEWSLDDRVESLFVGAINLQGRGDPSVMPQFIDRIETPQEAAGTGMQSHADQWVSSRHSPVHRPGRRRSRHKTADRTCLHHVSIRK